MIESCEAIRTFCFCSPKENTAKGMGGDLCGLFVKQQLVKTSEPFIALFSTIVSRRRAGMLRVSHREDDSVKVARPPRLKNDLF